MPVRRLLVAASVILAVLAAAALPALAAKVYRAERYHSRVVIEPGGSVVVTETVRFVFGPDPFTYVSRELPTRRTDGLTFLGASMDGESMERGKAAGQYEVRREDNGRRRIVWHFAPASNTAHEFAFTYRAAGVVWQDGDGDMFAWNLLPTKHQYAIGCASGELEYPAEAVLAEGAAFDPPAMEASHDGRVIRFERCPVPADGAWTVRLRFAARSVAPLAPGWQQRSIRNRESMPLFLGLGALILTGGIGGFVLFALRQRHETAGDAGAQQGPPDDLPPALAGALQRSGASAGWADVLGAILDLARRGAIHLSATGESRLLKRREVRVARAHAAVRMRPHERTLLDQLFTTKSGPRDSVTFSELAKTFASARNWRRLREAIAADLRTMRLVDPDREATRGRAIAAGVATIALALVGLVASVALIDQFGAPVLMVPIAMLTVGVAGTIAGSSVSTLTDEGHRRAERWSAFGRQLAGQAARASDSPALRGSLEHWLPYAAAFGSAVALAKRLEKQGVADGPSWLNVLALDGTVQRASMATTVVLLSAGASAGAHAGGGAGGAAAAGVAGGGSSSAG